MKTPPKQKRHVRAPVSPPNRPVADTTPDLHDKLVQRAVSSVGSGQISVEELVSAGVIRSQRYRQWLAERLRSLLPAASASSRRPKLHRARLAATDIDALLAEARRQIGDEAVHVTWGRKTVDGRPTGDDAIIVLVREKGPGKKPVPSRIRLKFDKRVLHAPTDVRKVAVGSRQAGSVRAGFHCGVVAGGATGTLSCALPGGDVLISGHVGRTKGVSVQANTVAGSTAELGAVLAVRDDGVVDAARVGPVDRAILSEVAITLPSSIRDLSLGDTGLDVRISLARGSGATFASVEVASEPAEFDGMQISELIRLDHAVTIHGDSGAPVFDGNDRLVGFVEGIADGHTYVLPATRIISGI